MTLSNPINECIQPYLEKGSTSSFFVNLSQGTLSKQIYDNYLIQDNIYLSVYKLALMQVGFNSKNKIENTLFLEAADSIKLEPATHINAAPLTQASHANLDYIDYLLRHCHGTLSHSIASIFPCFYFYYDMAKSLFPTHETHPYLDWFNCYTGKLFVSQTQTVTDIVNNTYENTDDKNTFLNIIEKGFDLEYRFHEFDVLDT